jgi:hypothetical protein
MWRKETHVYCTVYSEENVRKIQTEKSATYVNKKIANTLGAKNPV